MSVRQTEHLQWAHSIEVEQLRGSCHVFDELTDYKLGLTPCTLVENYLHFEEIGVGEGLTSFI